MSPTKEEILEKLKEMMQELFEMDPNDVTLESKLYEDLDLDSIDAVDLIVHLQKLTSRKFNPEEFKSARTISDVVNIIHAELSKDETSD